MLEFVSYLPEYFGMSPSFSCRKASLAASVALAFGVFGWPATSATELNAGLNAFTQALAAEASQDDAIAAFYRARDYAPLWTGPEDAGRRAVLFQALDAAPLHGLPPARYGATALRFGFQTAKTEGDRGRLEVAMSRAYLDFAHDISSGVLDPATVDSTIKRKVTRPAPALLLARAATTDFAAFLRGLPPDAPQYARLMKEKLRLEGRMDRQGFGAAILAPALAPGDQGAAVVQLRDRLAALGYLEGAITQTYDRAIQSAVQRFQDDNGLTADGVAGESTVAALNGEPEDRLKSIIVALERLRWIGGADLGKRHIWVNQPDFTAQIIDEGRVTFQTRAVIGRTSRDTRSPEFSDMMEFMVINPSWSVPRSIATKEYLPKLWADPNALGHLQVIDDNGRIVPRNAVDFAAYSVANFPFDLRQAPSDDNAMGMNLIREANGKESLKVRRKTAGWDQTYLKALITRTTQ